MEPLFARRSSLPSSFVAGLLGWTGTLVMAGYAFETGFRFSELFLTGLVIGAVQATAQTLLLEPLRMDRGTLHGIAWGIVGGLLFYLGMRAFRPFLLASPVAGVALFAFIGGAVGGFITYYRIDDERIRRSTPAGQPVSYGRDAHWTEPFAFGAFCYVLVLLPWRSADLAAVGAIVGAMTGVVAAGVSHFSPAGWKSSTAILLLLALIVGGVHGTITGWMLRGFEAEPWASPLIVGACAGALTYGVTLLRGRVLAGREAREPIQP